jgi:dTDP-glucose 4,6-dehydratase
LEDTDYSVRVIDKGTYAADKSRVFNNLKREEDKNRIEILEVDICDCRKEYLAGCDYVVNFAAESHVDNSISDGKPFIRSNVEGVFTLLECARKSPDLKKFIHISTDEVYGDMQDLIGEPKATESFPLRPSSYYSASKASADLLVQSVARTYGLPYIITRSCNNFGPNQDPEKFIPKIFKSIQEGKEVPVYGDGKQSREWMHVDDNVGIILNLMLSGATNEIFNIGSGHHLTNLEVVGCIGELLNSDVNYSYVPDRLGHDRVYSLDTSKLDKFFGDVFHGSLVYRKLKYFLKDEVARVKSFSNGG